MVQVLFWKGHHEEWPPIRVFARPYLLPRSFGGVRPHGESCDGLGINLHHVSAPGSYWTRCDPSGESEMVAGKKTE